jgi:hypothetical protein
MLRSTRAVYLASAAALLLVAPVGGQSRATVLCDQSIKPGTYRIFLTSDKVAPMAALLLLERLEGCLEATFIADGSPASGMELVSVSEGVITAKLKTSDGMATVRFKPGDAGITGDIAQGKRIWKVEGKKTA